MYNSCLYDLSGESTDNNQESLESVKVERYKSFNAYLETTSISLDPQC